MFHRPHSSVPVDRVNAAVQTVLDAAVVVLVTAPLAGCVSVMVCLGTMGIRTLSWPGVIASTHEAPPRHAQRLKVFDEVSYYPAEAPHRLLIRLPNGTLLSSEDITPESLTKPGEASVYMTAFADRSRTWQLVNAGTGEIFVYITKFDDGSECYNVRYRLGDLDVYFNGSRVSSIHVSGYWGPYKLFGIDRPRNSVPAIGLAPEKMYTLPIKERELVNLFGDPEKAEISYFVT